MNKTITNKKKWLVRTVVLLGLAGLCVWAFYFGLVVREYEITTDKIADDTSMRIVVIADLHSHIYGQAQRPLLDKIEAQQPDIIALVGDIVDDDEPQVGAKLFLDSVTDIAPVYYVSGNHEFWSGEMDSIKQMIRGYGITVLENERLDMTVNGVDISLCGIDDPEVFNNTEDAALLTLQNEEDILARFSNLEQTRVNILLAHRPSWFKAYNAYDFDVVLCGHTHGGQIRIPLILNGVISPDQGFFPKYVGGEYTHKNQTMIISRGLSFHPIVPRVFNPPEVVVVDIMGAKE